MIINTKVASKNSHCLMVIDNSYNPPENKFSKYFIDTKCSSEVYDHICRYYCEKCWRFERIASNLKAGI